MRRAAAIIVSLLADALSLLLRAAILLYRYGLSPVLGPHCRYTPSCSAYADQAIRMHGPLRGGWLTLRRITRCHPWGGMGYDPVPDAGSPIATAPIDTSLPDPNARS